jgi:hypothetical protein
MRRDPVQRSIVQEQSFEQVLAEGFDRLWPAHPDLLTEMRGHLAEREDGLGCDGKEGADADQQENSQHDPASENGCIESPRTGSIVANFNKPAQLKNIGHTHIGTVIGADNVVHARRGDQWFISLTIWSHTVEIVVRIN